MLFLPPGLRPARAGVIPRPGGSSGCSTAPSRPRGSDSPQAPLSRCWNSSVPPARE